MVSLCIMELLSAIMKLGFTNKEKYGKINEQMFTLRLDINLCYNNRVFVKNRGSHMRKKLIAIDLDGTLLRNDGTISEKNRIAVGKALENGHMVVLATGRGYRNSRFVLEKFPVFPYYINANGTTITQGRPEKSLFANNIPYETGCQIYQLAREYPTFIELYHGLDAYDSYEGCEHLKTCGKMEAYRKQLWETNIHMEQKQLDDFVMKERHLLSKFHIVCITVEEKEELMQRLAQIPGVFPISTESNNIEIADAHWSKKDALVWLCERIGMAQEDVLMVGDSANDYESICWAGTGIAVGNAAKKVLEAADYVTGTNEEDGVAQALAHFELI